MESQSIDGIEVNNIDDIQDNFINDDHKNKKLNFKIFLIPLLVLISIGIIVLIILFVLKSKNNNNPNNFIILKNRKDFDLKEIDNRNYEIIKMNNGLETLLISDINSETTGVSLIIPSGGIHDLTHGMAHFCEHMTFDGSKKYPNQGEFFTKIQNLGGTNDATTLLNRTEFFIEIPNDNLEIALDYFSSFLSEPLFNKENAEKEKSIVNSEFIMNKDDMQFLISNIMRKILNQKHPLSENWFGTGTLESLNKVSTDELLDQIKSYYNIYFQTSKLKLAIYSGKQMNDLENLMNKYFNYKSPESSKEDEMKFINITKRFNEPLISINERGNFILIDTVQLGYSILIQIYIEPLIKNIKDDLSKFFLFLLNSNTGGITKYFYSKGIILSFGLENYNEFSVIAIDLQSNDINLLQNANEFIHVIYWYINKIKIDINTKNTELLKLYENFKQLKYKENMFIDENNKDYKYLIAKKWAINMRQYKSIEEVIKVYLPDDDLNITSFNNFLDQLNVNNSIFCLLSQKKFEEIETFEILTNVRKLDKILEPYFEKYVYEGQFKIETLNKLNEFNISEYDLGYRSVNSFITNQINYTIPCDYNSSLEFNEKCEEDEYQKNKQNLDLQKIYPSKNNLDTKINKNELKTLYEPYKVYYQIDKQDRLPRTYIRIDLEGLYRTEKNITDFIIGDIYLTYLQALRLELVSMLSESYNYFSVSIIDYNFTISINSFSDKALDIIKKIKDNLFITLDKNLFTYSINYLKYIYSLSDDLTEYGYKISQRINYINYLNSEKYNEIANLTYDLYYELFNEFKKRMNIYLYIRGNINKNEVLNDYIPLFKEYFDFDHNIYEYTPIYYNLKDPNIYEYYTQSKESSENLILTTYKLSFDALLNGENLKYITDLFNNYIGYTYFTELRVNENLGYRILSSSIIKDTEYSFMQLFRSTILYPDQMMDKLDNVTNCILNGIIKIPTDFNNVRDSYIKNKLIISNNGGVRLNQAISILEYENIGGYEKYKEIINSIREITYNDTIKYIKENIINNPKKIDILIYNKTLDNLDKRIESLKGKKYQLNNKYEIKYTYNLDFLK